MVGKIGVVGAGTMGRGIAESCLAAGFDVVLLDSTIELASKGYQGIEKSLDRGVQRGRITAQARDEMLAKLIYSDNYDDLKDAEVVLEAVYEDMEVKKDVLTRVSQVAGKDVLIGSNTSSLSITGMSGSVDNPARFMGIHFFNPVPVMKLVELIKGSNTSKVALDKARELCLRLGKTPVVVKESPGFVVNRLLCPMLNEAAYLLMEGVASAEDIDTAMKLGANHPMGPLSLADLIGIDVLYAIMDTLHKDFGDDKYKPCPLLKEMIDKGHLGRKTGQGFFKY
ncbi:MAG TPA: 3-hydroxybutyryl-CoA dehydrogenase [Firmicutes bacterium]|jgi:3-hydroxybutyryl-CoA dehydrogenase|nr:3-hydroxybutyryl-CoA dehydrogenase [Bacillota bacterium]